MNRLLVLAFLFYIGCMTGWVIELFYRRFISKNNPQRKWINPGFLVGPWLPLYGFGLCGMYGISEILLRHPTTGVRALDTTIILIVMMIVMTVLELIAGLIFVKGFNVKLWDYTNEKLNFQGLICPKFSFIWGLLGCIYFFVINPYVLDGIIWLSQHLAFSFFIGMFFGVFIIDVTYSMQLVNKMRKFAEEKEIKIHYEELKADLARQREERREKARFIFSFRTSRTLVESMDRYFRELNEETKQRLSDIIKS